MGLLPRQRYRFARRFMSAVYMPLISTVKIGLVLVFAEILEQVALHFQIRIRGVPSIGFCDVADSFPPEHLDYRRLVSG